MTAARPDTWMPFYIGDYLRDTGRLTTEGHGAYVLLIFDYWTSGAPLPDDDAQLAAITKLPMVKWKKLRPVLAQFFSVSDGVWRHGRVDHEIGVATGITGNKSKAGKAGAEARWQKHGRANGSRLADGPLRQWQTDAPSQSPSQSQDKNAIPLSESSSSTSSAIGAERSGKMMKLGSVISGSDGDHWSQQRARDEFAVTACIPYLPGGDDGQRWALALAAEDPAAENHVAACRAMSKAAKSAGVGWVSPERRARA